MELRKSQLMTITNGKFYKRGKLERSAQRQHARIAKREKSFHIIEANSKIPKKKKQNDAAVCIMNREG